MCSDDGELPTPEEIADVTGGDIGKIRDGFRAFAEMDDTHPSKTKSDKIGETPGVGRDIRPTLCDYRRQGWHWIEQSAGENEE
jgi:hypothetical protein